MEKLPQDIKAMVDSITIPAKLNETVHEALEIGCKKNKRSFQQQNIIATIASIFLLSIVAVLFTSYYEDSANSVIKKEKAHYSNSVLYNSNDEGLKRMAKEGKVKNLSLVAEDQGVKVIFEEGYLDNQQMAIAYRVEYNEHKNRANKETDISLELFIDGKSAGLYGSGGINAKDLSQKGDIFTFRTDKYYPSNPELKIHIDKINNIVGNWTFTFHLKKENEYIVKHDIASEQDKSGNFFSVNRVQLTPSKLLLNTTISLQQDKTLPVNSYLHYSVVAQGKDGLSYFSNPSARSNNNDNAYEELLSNLTKYETLNIERNINTYSYKILPYIASYTGKETSNGQGFMIDKLYAPFKEGSILKTDSKIKAAKIIETSNNTVVYYEMDLSLPIFPKIVDRTNDLSYEAISFIQQNDYFIVTYPKVKKSESLQLIINDIAYKALTDLEIKFDLKNNKKN